MASLAKWLSVRSRTKWLWVRVPLLPFSKLDAIVTLFRLRELFFDDVLVDMIDFVPSWSLSKGKTLVWKLLIKKVAHCRHVTA